MKKIAFILVILSLIICLSSCNQDDIDEILERLPYDVELLHEHSWDNWELVYDEANVNLVCSVCGANVISYPISQGLEIENGVLVGKGTCEDEYVVVPQGVTVIGDGAFANEKNIKGVLLPKTVTKIEDNAFKSCDGLQVINIPNGVTEIGEKAFHSCKALIGVLIPHSVTIIGKQAFANCGYLEIIYYVGTEADWNAVEKGKNWNQGAGKHVVEFKFVIGDEPIPHVHVWSDWTIVKEPTIKEEGLKERYCDCGEKESENIPVDEFVDGSFGLEYVLNEDGQSYSVVGIGICTDTELVIPSEYKGLPVTMIGASAFYQDHIINVSIPDSVIEIGARAFRACPFLETVDMGDGVISLGYGAFRSSTALKNVEFSKSLVFIDEYAFDDCSALESAVFYEGLQTISDRAFRDCAALETVSLPNSLTTIGQRSFRGCYSLKSIVIPDSVTHLGIEVFRDCYALESVTLGRGITVLGDDIFHNCTSLKNIIVTDNVTAINVEAFRGCTSLESITIGKSVQSIDSYSLAECPSMKTITIPDNVTIIGNGAFYSSTGLETVNIGSGVLTIDNWAFYGCRSLKTINYNGTISQWNDISFGWYWDYDTPEYTIYCTDGTITKDGTVTYYEPEPQPEGSQGLEYALNADGQSYSVVGMGTCTDTNLVIPSEYNGLPVTAIADMAFAPLDANYMPRDPYNIVSVKLPETIKTIGSMAFGGIPTLKNVDLPDSIEIVQGYAFVGSEALEYAEYDGALYLGNENNPYLVFVNPKDTNVISCRIHDETKVIGGIAFNECKMLETVYLGDGVKYISPSAFMGCSMLNNFIIGEGSSLISIANSAFYGCSSLVNIELPNSLKNIDNSAFAQCTSLTKVLIPESVEFIGEYAFEWCSALTIYCEAEAQPNEWDVNWNSKGAYSGNQFISVVWNYKPE